jgi:hypothetical protein
VLFTASLMRAPVEFGVHHIVQEGADEEKKETAQPVQHIE